MKLRLRYRGQTCNLDLPVEAAATLEELMLHVIQVLNVDVTIQLSLNGKDPICSREESAVLTIRDAGLVPGDLLFVLEGKPPTDQCEISGLVENSSTGKEMAGVEEDSLKANCSCTDVEKLLVCALESSPCKSANDAIAVAIHTILTESGFSMGGLDCGHVTPAEWKSDVVYRLEYSHISCASLSVRITMMPLAKTVLFVYGSLKAADEAGDDVKGGNDDEEVVSLKVNPMQFVDNICTDGSKMYKNLSALSRQIKDSVVYPLLANARRLLGLEQVYGILAIPYELQIAVFSLLDVKSLLNLMETCRYMASACKDRYLWHKLYTRDFQVLEPMSLNVDWFLKYKAAIIRQQAERRLQVEMQRGCFPEPPHFAAVWQGPENYVPGNFGIIGGDYDLNPFGGRGLAHPRFIRPRFDPPSPFTDPLTDPFGTGSGRGRGGGGFAGLFPGPRFL